MCGITGLVSKNKNIDIQHISMMTDVLRHRGPDGEGFALFSQQAIILAGGVDTPKNIFNAGFIYSPKQLISASGNQLSGVNLAFGHRRLAIIDLTPAGHQPMCSQDEMVWITYNGEIYNYLELREELKNKGHHFLTNTDTEVILAAYCEWGEQCLDKFNGMWSFVIFDKQKNILFGSRDRFGVKPFYYFRDADYFAFASELKSVIKLPFVKKEINKAALFDYLFMGKVESEEEGMFKNIFELPPAHNFVYNLGDHSFKKWRYYSLPVNLSYEDFDEKKLKIYAEHIRELIDDAVRLRLRSDVAVGSCLSGGIDSSAIVCVINDILKGKTLYQVGERQKVFTASFEDEKFDESQFAMSVAEQSNASWFQVFPDRQGFLQNMEDIHFSQDIPIWSTSTFAQYSVMKLAKENGVKVLMDGQGGDELFGGYPHYFISYWRELIKNFCFGKFYSEYNHFELFSHPFNFGVKQFFKNDVLGNMPSSLMQRAYREIYPEARYLHPDLWNQNKDRIASANRNSFSSLNKNLHSDFDNSVLKGYLKFEDRSSMWFSVESRTPFSDDIHLIEYVFGIPSSYKIQKSVSKYLLRESCKNILPKKISNRKDKKGFVTPNNRWIREMRNDFRKYFTDDLKEFLNMDLLMKDYDHFFNPETDTENYRIFKFISFAVWKKVFNL